MNFKKLIYVSVFFHLFFSAISLVAQTVPLPEAALRTGSQLYWDPFSQSGVFEKNGHHFSFQVEEPLVLLDYRKLAITDPPQIKDGVVYVSESFIETANQLFSTNTSDNHYRIGAILIDPGHGGKDPGAIGSYTKNGKRITINEKDITLDISLKLAEKLRQLYPDKKIIMTRSDDTWLSLEDRVDMANSIQLEAHEAILYVSVHVNASLDKKATGYEVWYLSPGYRRTVIDPALAEGDEFLATILNSMMEEEYTTESILMAKFILDGLTAQIGNQSPSRGIKEEEWFVVRNVNMPSVLIETGFITNEKEAALLASQEYLRKLAQGIYNGLVAFVTNFERSRGFTNTQ